jgi:hypothetical protein
MTEAPIAQALGRSEKTVTRWIKRGALPAAHDGPFINNLLVVRAADVERLKLAPHQGEEK